MLRKGKIPACSGFAVLWAICACGCSTSGQAVRSDVTMATQTVQQPQTPFVPLRTPPVEQPVAFVNYDAPPVADDQLAAFSEPDEILPQPVVELLDLDDLVAAALANNPRLTRLQSEARAAWARVPQVKALPDPTVDSNIFVRPMVMGDGNQRAMLGVSQMIPSLKRLNAQGQEATFEALAREQLWRAEQLNLTAEVKGAYYRLYVLGQQLQINQQNQQLLETLVQVANARVRTGAATQGDVLSASLELSRLVEERLALQQQLASTKAILNRRLNRPAEFPVAVPHTIAVPEGLPPFDALRVQAFEQQPEIAAARLRTQATAWGMRVAQLESIPDVTLSVNWIFMEPNDLMPVAQPHGGDPWSIGTMVNVPLWQRKYRAIRSEAASRHRAAHAETEELLLQYDEMLFDAVQQFRAETATATLYRTTILPQARQTFEADQQAYVQGVVGFDRLLGDFRNLLTIEAAHHRALGQAGMALARIEQLTGVDRLESEPPDLR